MKQALCTECANFNCFIQRFCSEACLLIAQNSKSQIRYKKGEYIFTEGSPVRGIYFIYTGKVKIVTSGVYNNEQIVRLANKGHILGHRGYGGETYPIGAVALEPTIVCFLDNNAFRDLMDQNPGFAHGLIIFYCQELRNAERRNKYLSQMTIREKVTESLLYYIKVFGYDQKTGLINVDLPRNDLSNLAGTNADQVSRIISELKQAGMIEASGKHIYLRNHANLKAVVDKFNIPL